MIKDNPELRNNHESICKPLPFPQIGYNVAPPISIQLKEQMDESQTLWNQLSSMIQTTSASDHFKQIRNKQQERINTQQLKLLRTETIIFKLESEVANLVNEQNEKEKEYARNPVDDEINLRQKVKAINSEIVPCSALYKQTNMPRPFYHTVNDNSNIRSSSWTNNSTQGSSQNYNEKKTGNPKTSNNTQTSNWTSNNTQTNNWTNSNTQTSNWTNNNTQTRENKFSNG